MKKDINTTKKIFGLPIKVVNDSDMRQEMLSSPEGTMFLVGENVYKFPEGDNKVELVWAKIIKTRD